MGLEPVDFDLGHALRARARKVFVVAIWVLWVAATWALEKRVGLFMRYDPAGRTLYALVANVAIGTLLAGFAARRWAPTPWRTRPFVLALTAVLGGLVVAKAAPPAAREVVVLVNAFAQILPTSIAEVVTCWLLVGGAVHHGAKRLGAVPAKVLAIVVADVVFAVYHVAHSAPFDRPEMIAFLALPGLVTGVIVFVARDPVAAILAQNFLAMIGITKSADLDVFRHPFVWAYAVAVVAALAAREILRGECRRANGAHAHRTRLPAGAHRRR